MKRLVIVLGCWLLTLGQMPVAYAQTEVADSTQLTLDSLTRELQAMKLKEMLMRDALDRNGQLARLDSMRKTVGP